MLYPLSYERSSSSIPCPEPWLRAVRTPSVLVHNVCWLPDRPLDPSSTRTNQPAVRQLLYTDYMSVGFRPTEEDLRVIEANRRKDEKTSDVIRRALRLLDREAWEERARADMHLLKSEDLSAEANAWEYDADGNIRIVGTNVTVQPRPTDRS